MRFIVDSIKRFRAGDIILICANLPHYLSLIRKSHQPKLILPLSSDVSAKFNAELSNEAHNLTEHGEKEAVSNLTNAFINLQESKPLAEKAVRKYLRQIETINMQAIVNKNEKAQASVEESTVFLGFAAAFAFLVLFSFSVNFPGIVINPLNTLLKDIRGLDAH